MYSRSTQYKETTIARIPVFSPFLQENRKASRLDFNNKPSAIALTGTGDAIVCAEPTDDCVTVFANPAGEWEKLSIISSLNGSKKSLSKPCCVGVTPDNCIVVIDTDKQLFRLFKVKMDGKLVATANLAALPHQFQSPNALAVHPCGKIFVVDSGAHSVSIFNADLTFSRFIGRKGQARGFFDQPHSVAFDSMGHVYISDSENNRIQKFVMNGELFKVDVFGHGNGTEVSHLKQPTALSISSYDTVFVFDEHKRIAAFDTQGCFLGEVLCNKIVTLTKPSAMVINKDESYLCVLDKACYVMQ